MATDATTESVTGLSADVPPGFHGNTLAEAFQLTAAARADIPALRLLGGDEGLTWQQYADQVELIAAALHRLGLRRGDRLALMLKNRPEGNIVDMAAMHVGATPFSLYNTSPAEDLHHVLSDANPKILVTEQAFLPIVGPVAREIGGIEHILVVDGPAADAMDLADACAQGSDGFDFEASWRAVEPDDIVTLIYTSGTTGPSKGVQITHRGLLMVMRSLSELLLMPTNGESIGYLPMAHIAERATGHYLQVLGGDRITFVADATRLGEALREVRPTRFLGVPRIWEKLRAGLMAAVAANPDEEKRSAITGAIDFAVGTVRATQAGQELSAEQRQRLAALDEKVFAPLRAAIGLDRVGAAIVGAAPSAPEMLEFFYAIGIPVLEVWGMSESSGLGTVNPPSRPRIGTVGVPIPGVEVRLAEEDGEILLRGANVMPGYRNMPDKTAEAIDDQGWLHTGDVGAWDDGYLRIIDRKKELIINAAGKNMSPANIEAQLKSGSPVIAQAICIGDSRPYNTALIVLDPDAAAAFGKQHGATDTSLAALAQHPALRAEVAAGVGRANAKLARVEQIKRFALLENDWLPAGDELTPTMKLKRKPIHAKYTELIESLYAGGGLEPSEAG
ncbi:MAG: AMP-dependent synthetase/ligase [Pseudonocardia sp.]